jgi:hypothetical protein
MAGEGPTICGGCVSQEVSETFRQSAARYNDRSAFANNAAMDGSNMMQMQFMVAAQNTLEQDPGSQLAGMLAQLAAVVNGRPTNTAGGS